MTFRDMRLRRMLTQKELADLMDVSYQTIQAWESGQSRPRPGKMRQLCEVLQVEPDELFSVINAGLAEDKQGPGMGKAAA